MVSHTSSTAPRKCEDKLRVKSSGQVFYGPFLHSGSGRHPILRLTVVVGIVFVLAMTLLLQETNDSLALTNLMTSSGVEAGPHATHRVPMPRQDSAFKTTGDVFRQIEVEETGQFKGLMNIAQETNWSGTFIDYQQLAESEPFSASWLQQRESFMTMNLEDIGICEDAAFLAFKDDRFEKVKMTMDWLDFAVEHMSKWYKITQVTKNDIPYRSAIEKLDAYLEQGSQYPMAEEPFLQEAIAVIAFRPLIQDSDHPEQARNVTVCTLAATVESLRRTGMGRVVVVGMEAEDQEYADEAFQFVMVHQSMEDKSDPLLKDAKRVGHMELAFVQGHMGHATTPFVPVNVPRAALMGLREAFLTQQQADTDHDTIVNMTNWLGNHKLNHWKYVYLTEPDSILATRPSTLKTLKKHVDEGGVLIPWRLQPIPHESDVRGVSMANMYLEATDHFKEVLELDALASHPDKCCDELNGPDFKPGLPPHFPECGNFWYMCGFADDDHEMEPNAHDRLKPYKLIRLKHGTQMTHLASSEHGRRCAPIKSVNADHCRVINT